MAASTAKKLRGGGAKPRGPLNGVNGGSTAAPTTLSEVAASHGWGRDLSGLNRVMMTKLVVSPATADCACGDEKQHQRIEKMRQELQ